MLGLLLCAALASGAEPTPEELRFFESQVRPVLIDHCQKCHGEKKQWGGLRLDSRAALLAGGDSGPAVVPGRPNESLLIQAIRHSNADLKMPENGKLDERQIAALERWVSMGVPFPPTAPPSHVQRDPNHWAFLPPVAHPLPTVADLANCRSWIDPYLRVRQQEHGIVPVPESDRGTLVRRLTFQLTGLPPTAEAVDEFLRDENADAYERLLDRLLASPAYGQHWGRHWLDVARYADSNGLDENIAHGNAWRYRDYVVDSMNRDKPIDQFIVEQLAGDLLPATTQAVRHEQLIATGFLSIGPKVLAEVDQAKMRMDIVDEQIDTTGRALLGMTLGCARCHDHKFDPIATADYYALAGIFKSSKSMETYTKVARWHEHLLPSDEATAMKAAHDAKLAGKRREIETFVAAADQEARKKLAADAKPPEKLETLYPEPTQATLKKLREELAAIEKSPPDLPAAMGVTEDAIADVAIHVRGNPLKLGDIIARRVPTVMRGPEPPQFSTNESGRKSLASWLVDPRHPLTSRVFVNRVWRWHFGKGLVRTVDNFGLLGERPTHPELLDTLARRFIADGWSLKRLHRDLLTSATYRQDSRASSQANAADPDNRWFGRAELRRLEAESVRDSLLAVSGQLDTAFGGTLLKVKNRAYLFDHTSIDTTDYSSRRRSLYQPVIRNNVYDLFQILDFPDPAISSGDRVTTTVASQALLWMNSDFVMQCAQQLAERVSAEEATPERRLERLYRLVFGRPPTAAETQANLAFLARVEQETATQPATDSNARPTQPLAILCQTLLASSEFLYLR
jgi:cytochrome c553